LVHPICSFRRRSFWQSPIFDIFKSQQAALNLLSFLAEKRGFLGYCLLRLKDTKNQRQPKDAPRIAASFIYQTSNSLINICSLKDMVRSKNRPFLMG
jgi:hypothetical protein